MASDDFCYLTTIGRRSGRPHTIEIWYAESDGGQTLYLMAGGGDESDWVRNLRADSRCTVRVGSRDALEREARGRILEAADEEEELARTLVFDKFQPRYGGDLTNWRGRSLPVAIDLLDQTAS